MAGRLTATLETIARISGELGSMAQSINFTNNLTVLAEHPAFMRIQATMLKALAAFPDARGALVAALRQMDENNAPLPLPAAVASPRRNYTKCIRREHRKEA